MTGEAFNRIKRLMQQAQFGEAVAACHSELAERTDPAFRPHVITALCLCLAGTGRAEDAAAAYAMYRNDLLSDAAFPYTTAALAARCVPDIQTWFHERSVSYVEQPIAFSRISTMESWSRSSGVAPAVIDPPQTVVPAAPGRAPYVADPFLCYRIPDGEFIAGWDFVFAADNIFLADSGYMPVDLQHEAFPALADSSLNLIAHVWPADAQEAEEDVLFFSCTKRFHVGHFLLDFLPRLRSLAVLSPDMRIAIPQDIPQKLFDLIACFGIARDRMYLCETGKRYRFRNLFVSRVGDLERPNPNNAAFLRAEFAPPARETSGARGYYLQRAAGTRKIVNQAEVDRVLAEFNITPLDLQSMSIAEQRAALAKAHIIIGTYGSELLACLFMPAGGHAIELIWGASDTTIEWCVRSGLRHQYLKCAPAEGAGKMKKDSDMIVDCDELRRRLAALS